MIPAGEKVKLIDDSGTASSMTAAGNWHHSPQARAMTQKISVAIFFSASTFGLRHRGGYRLLSVRWSTQRPSSLPCGHRRRCASCGMVWRMRRRPIRRASFTNPLCGVARIPANSPSSVERSARPQSADICLGAPKRPPRLGVTFAQPTD